MDTLKKIRNAGFTLTLIDSFIEISPADQLTQQQRQFLKAHRDEIISELQEEQKVLNWLASIGETDPEIIEDTLARCRADSEALVYFLRRSDTNELNDKKVSVHVNDDSIPILGQTECYDEFDDWEE